MHSAPRRAFGHEPALATRAPAEELGVEDRQGFARVAEFGGTIKTHECDVTKSADVKAMIEACLSAFGRIDVLVGTSLVAKGIDIPEVTGDVRHGDPVRVIPFSQFGIPVA